MKSSGRILLAVQVFKFGFIGGLAALVNLLIVWLLVDKALFMKPLVANIFAFLVAFWVSYFGHSRLTFNHTRHKMRFVAPKFFLIAICSFILNETLYFLLLHLTPLSYLWSLFIVLMIVPVFTFVLSKIWAFR